MAVPGTIQLKEFCRLFKFDDRRARYVMEEGHVPDGVRRTPRTGNRRDFDPEQAFWLAIVLKLKEVGIQTPLAAKVADYSIEALRTVTQNLNWEWRFLPMKGWFDTESQYYVDVGDLKYIRLLTDSCPSKQGLYEFDWHPVHGKRKPIKNPELFVIVRVDLTRIARVLNKVDGWSCPQSHIVE